MNKEWSETNKRIQALIGKSVTYDSGIDLLLEFRKELFDVIKSFFDTLVTSDFSAIPYMNSTGYHNKTMAYSIWHIFRIEDIVAHTLLRGEEQVFFRGNYQERINSPIVTTGNELQKQEIADFSKRLNLEQLLSYASEVRKSTDDIVRGLFYVDMRRKPTLETKEYLRSLHVVSEDPEAVWLIDYWCDKDIRGLIKMPFSRHWIMHIEACLRIIGGISQKCKGK